MSTYDVIVVGLGGIGSAALYQLALRGARVLGIDRFPIAHDRGSSHGQTRIIRQAYFEHPDYVPLLRRSYELWADLEARHGRRLFHPVGLLQVGPPNGEVVSGVLASAREHQLDIQQLTAREISERWPGLRIPQAEHSAVFERAAGYLEVENCVRAHFEQARQLGASACFGEAVQSWHCEHNDVTVQTEKSTFTARHLVLAAGPWSSQLLTEMDISLRVVRKSMFWFPAESDLYTPDRCPCFLFETPAGEFYGFPQLAPHGVKVAEHTGGDPVDNPLDVCRELDTESLKRVQAFAGDCLPRLGTQLNHHAVCMYTMSADKHFVLDRHPRFANVSFVAGLSGHGFKFAPVLGHALADLALEGSTPLPVEFLRADRFKSESID